MQWNHSDLSGRAGWAVTREWGGCERNGYWVDLGGAKYADQTVTGWLHGPYETYRKLILILFFFPLF